MQNKWTESEDRILQDMVQGYLDEGQSIKWVEIARRLPERTNKGCRKRWAKLDSGRRTGNWTEEEDWRLKDAVETVGKKWVAVAKMVNGRTPDQCQKRWQNAVNPELNCGRWTEAEDECLRDAIEAVGTNWSLISRLYFPHRSPQHLSNRAASKMRVWTGDGTRQTSHHIVDSTAESPSYEGDFTTEHSLAYRGCWDGGAADQPLPYVPNDFDIDQHALQPYGWEQHGSNTQQGYEESLSNVTLPNGQAQGGVITEATLQVALGDTRGSRTTLSLEGLDTETRDEIVRFILQRKKRITIGVD